MRLRSLKPGATAAAAGTQAVDHRIALFGFPVRRMFAAEATVFAEFQLVGRRPLVLGRRIVAPFALRT
jgi:hypothetical protein